MIKPSFNKLDDMFAASTSDARRAANPRFSFEGHPQVTFSADGLTANILYHDTTSDGSIHTRMVKLHKSADEQPWRLVNEVTNVIDVPSNKGSKRTADKVEQSWGQAATAPSGSKRCTTAAQPSSPIDDDDEAILKVRKGATVNVGGYAAKVTHIDRLKTKSDMLGFASLGSVVLTLDTGVVIEIPHG